MEISKNFVYIGAGGKTLQRCRRHAENLKKEEIDLTGPDGNGVVSIGPDCFNGFINLKRVKLPKTIVRICSMAFYSCKKLEQINLNDHITKIGECAFCGTNLKEFVVPPQIRQISRSICDNCTAMEKIVLHDNITKIGASAFFNTKIKEITLPSKLKELCAYSFAHTYIEEIEIPQGIKELENYVFAYTKLKRVVIPETVEKISPTAFYDCKNLEKIYISEKTLEADVGKGRKQNLIIYASKKSSAYIHAKENGNQVVEVPSLNQVKLICKEDNTKLLLYVLKKYNTEDWFFDELFMKTAKEHKAEKCLELLKQWKKEKFNQ